MMFLTVAGQISWIFLTFAAILKTEEIREAARNNPGDFTRNRGSLPLHTLLLYVIFRNCKDTNSELAYLYSHAAFDDASGKRPTRQAVNKRLRCLNKDVWPVLSRKFTDLVYSAPLLTQKIKGRIVWATDSSSLEMPPSLAATTKYGKHTNNHSKKESDSGKVIVRCGGLYDVVNRFFVDYVIKPFKESEMAIVLEQIHIFASLLTKHKIIILADRGYASLPFMAVMEKLGYEYCVRVTSKTYKALVKGMASDDDYIEIKITKSLLSRITDPEALSYLAGMEVFRVRVVKKHYTNPKSGATEWMILFTNLPESEFSTGEMFDLYNRRWAIETAYYSLKVVLEVERHVSLDPDIAINILYGKIMFYNFSALFREQLDLMITRQERILEEAGKPNKYHYQTNVKALIAELYASDLMKCLLTEDNIEGVVTDFFQYLVCNMNKLKTAIRPGRHYDRWGKPVTCSYKYKFKIDGRNHQRVALVGGMMRTVKP